MITLSWVENRLINVILCNSVLHRLDHEVNMARTRDPGICIPNVPRMHHKTVKQYSTEAMKYYEAMNAAKSLFTNRTYF